MKYSMLKKNDKKTKSGPFFLLGSLEPVAVLKSPDVDTSMPPAVVMFYDWIDVNPLSESLRHSFCLDLGLGQQEGNILFIMITT